MWFTRMFPFMNNVMPPSKNKSFYKRIAQFENDLWFQNVFANYYNITMNNIKVNNLPDTCDERFLKMVMINGCNPCMVHDETDPEIAGYATLAAARDMIDLNIYGYGRKGWAYGYNGFNKQYSCYMPGSEDYDVDMVIGYDNDLCYPILNYIIAYSKSIADTMRTIMTTAQKLKYPFIAIGGESSQKGFEKMMSDYYDNVDCFLLAKDFDIQKFNVFDTHLRENALSVLWEHKHNLEEEARTILGIQGAINQDKKERLLVDEVNGMQDQTTKNQDYRVECWNLFCDRVNKCFGLNISIEVNEDDDEAFYEDEAGAKQSIRINDDNSDGKGSDGDEP